LFGRKNEEARTELLTGGAGSPAGGMNQALPVKDSFEAGSSRKESHPATPAVLSWMRCHAALDAPEGAARFCRDPVRLHLTRREAVLGDSMVELTRDRSARIRAAAPRVVALGFFLLGAGVAPALTQEGALAQADQTLRVTTNVVNVYAVVKEKKNRPVADLKREDFELTEDNVPQEMRYFSRETDTPLTLGILVDTSPSQQRVLGIEQEEAKTFLGQVLRPKDLAFVLQFDVQVELLHDFTSSVGLLARAIDGARINGGGRGPIPGTIPDPDPCCTKLHDAVYLAATELLKSEIGRKVVILLSDGEDRGSKVELKQALEAAQRSDVIVYSIAIIDRAAYWGQVMGFHGDSVLKKYAEDTGGRVIEVRNARDTSAAFQEIAEELRTQYLLGYTPSNTQRDGSFRKIRVRVRDRDYKIQARRGYYAPTK